VGTLNRRWTRAGNRIGVWMYRTLDGRLASGSKDVHVLMITTPGRRTGLPRSTCVRYLDSDEGFVVWGTGAGSPQRGSVWNGVVLVQAPGVAKYARRAGRVIPVAVLEPTEDTG
jgi:hypothetical protein